MGTEYVFIYFIINYDSGHAVWKTISVYLSSLVNVEISFSKFICQVFYLTL